VGGRGEGGGGGPSGPLACLPGLAADARPPTPAFSAECRRATPPGPPLRTTIDGPVGGQGQRERWGGVRGQDASSRKKLRRWRRWRSKPQARARGSLSLSLASARLAGCKNRSRETHTLLHAAYREDDRSPQRQVRLGRGGRRRRAQRPDAERVFSSSRGGRELGVVELLLSLPVLPALMPFSLLSSTAIDTAVQRQRAAEFGERRQSKAGNTGKLNKNSEQHRACGRLSRKGGETVRRRGRGQGPSAPPPPNLPLKAPCAPARSG